MTSLFTSLLMLMSQTYHYSPLFYLMEDLAVNWLLLNNWGVLISVLHLSALQQGVLSKWPVAEKGRGWGSKANGERVGA